MKRVMMLASAVLAAGVGVGVVSAAAAAAAPGGVAARHGPKIVAKPGTVMAHRSVTLTGSGFRRHRKVTIWECSQTAWIVPQQVCNHGNAVTVRTSARGGFTVKFRVLACPAVRLAVPATSSKRCFIGVPLPRGVDTIVLLPATRITVTGIR